MRTHPARRHSLHSPRSQRGAVLYVVLIMLVLMALLGIAGMQVTSMQERMAANYLRSNVAFQNAEADAGRPRNPSRRRWLTGASSRPARRNAVPPTIRRPGPMVSARPSPLIRVASTSALQRPAGAPAADRTKKPGTSTRSRRLPVTIPPMRPPVRSSIRSSSHEQRAPFPSTSFLHLAAGRCGCCCACRPCRVDHSAAGRAW